MICRSRAERTIAVVRCSFCCLRTEIKFSGHPSSTPSRDEITISYNLGDDFDACDLSRVLSMRVVLVPLSISCGSPTIDAVLFGYCAQLRAKIDEERLTAYQSWVEKDARETLARRSPLWQLGGAAETRAATGYHPRQPTDADREVSLYLGALLSMAIDEGARGL